MKLARIFLASVVCVMLFECASFGVTRTEFEAKLENAKHGDVDAMLETGVEIHKRLKSNANLRLLAESYFLRLKSV